MTYNINHANQLTLIALLERDDCCAQKPQLWGVSIALQQKAHEKTELGFAAQVQNTLMLKLQPESHLYSTGLSYGPFFHFTCILCSIIAKHNTSCTKNMKVRYKLGAPKLLSPSDTKFIEPDRAVPVAMFSEMQDSTIIIKWSVQYSGFFFFSPVTSKKTLQ